MSNLKNETIADIVAEMRQDIADGTVGIWADFGGEVARGYADRIEAAHKRLAIPTPEQWTEIARQGAEIADLKRENDALKRKLEAGAEEAQICGEIGEIVGREAARQESLQGCNAAAMCEALEQVRFYLPHFLQYMRLHRKDEEAGGYYERILEVVNAALAKPPRNCDRPECATTKSAQDVWRKEDGGKTAYYEWLFAEAKGYEK